MQPSPETRRSTDQSPDLPPLALTDAQMSAIWAASHPIAPDRRVDFLTDVVRELAALPMVGDGVLHRIVTAVQRKYFDPPLESHHGRSHGVGKYAR